MTTLTLVTLLVACSGPSTETAPDGPPRSASSPSAPPKRAPAARAPAPPRKVVEIDLSRAEPMRLAEKLGPGGTPTETLQLVFASRGDGEIEPCG